MFESSVETASPARRATQLIALCAASLTWLVASCTDGREVGVDPGFVATGIPGSDAVSVEIGSVSDGAFVEGVLIHHLDAPMIVDPLAIRPSNEFPYGEVYSGLVRISRDLDGLPEGDLSSGWSVSEDGLRYTFFLRDQLRFSNGEQLTARDIKWSWERALTPGYVTERSQEVLGVIVGAREMIERKTRELQGVNVIDEATLTVDLTRRQAHFVQALADPVASVLSRKNVEGWGTLNWVHYDRLNHAGLPLGAREFDVLPAGTGPFRITRLVGTEFAVLEPNPHHWRGAPQFVNRVLVVSPSGYRHAGLPDLPSEKQLDVLWTNENTYEHVEDHDWKADGFPENPWARFGAFAHLGPPEVSFLAFNSAVAPFHDVDFRRALQLSANREGPREVVRGGVNDSPARGLLPPGFPGHGPERLSLGPNQASAVASIVRSDIQPGSPEIVIEILDDGSAPYVGFYRTLARNWEDWLQLRVEDNSRPGLTTGDLDSYAAGSASGESSGPPVVEFIRRLTSGTLQLRYVHVHPRYPDPCAVLCRIPDLFGPNAQSDETRQLRELLDDAAATADRAARIAKYQAIEAHILDRALVIPVFWDDGMTYRLVKDYISGYKVSAYGGSMYEDVVVDTTHPDYPRERLSGGWGGGR